MAEEESKGNDPPRGNEWEVVTLTASAYAAAPGPERAEPGEEDGQDKMDAKNEAETSSPMFMSKHFVFPPSQHENLPLEPDYSEEIQSEKETGEDDTSQLVQEDVVTSDIIKDEDNVTTETLILYDKDNSLSDEGLGNAESIHDETTMGISTTDESIEPLDSALGSGLQESQKSVEEDEKDGVDLPCEAWWKRRALSLYAHAKEANTFWSIFIASAVVGLVIIGHQWQHERWKALHFKCDGRMDKMVGRISRFKDVIVGGHKRGSLVRRASSGER